MHLPSLIFMQDSDARRMPAHTVMLCHVDNLTSCSARL
jgi:hypothetical protein